MSGEAWLYLFAVIINAVNLFLQVFFTIMYSDLEWYGSLVSLSRAHVSSSSSRGGFVGWQQHRLGSGQIDRLRWICLVTPTAAACLRAPSCFLFFFFFFTWLSMTNVVLARSDYINPIDLCNRLNTYIIPEVAVHGFLTFLFLINGYWLPLILNLPLLGWNVKKCVEAKGPWM
jgi:hypothetical protein